MDNYALDYLDEPFLPELILFDFDGTLCATHDAILHSLEHTLLRFTPRAPSSDQLIKALSKGLPLREVFPTIYGESRSLSEDEIEAHVLAYKEIYKKEGWQRSFLFNGVREVLYRARQQGIRLGIVSNKSIEALHRASKLFEIEEYFEVIIGEGSSPYAKPDARIFHELIATTPGCPDPSQILMVGDALPDLVFAEQSGIRSCWAAYGYGDPSKCRRRNPDYIVHYPYGLTEFVEVGR